MANVNWGSLNPKAVWSEQSWQAAWNNAYNKYYAENKEKYSWSSLVAELESEEQANLDWQAEYYWEEPWDSPANDN